MANINKIMYYVLYIKSIIENEEFYMKCYFKNNTLKKSKR